MQQFIPVYWATILSGLLLSCTAGQRSATSSPVPQPGDRSATTASKEPTADNNWPVERYLDYSGTETLLSGGSRSIAISTPKGTFKVWTKRIGNNPDMKVLILHGGPGGSHEMYEAFDSYLPRAGIEYYYYDQLGSFNSDKPEEASLWTVERFVDEVEQVRRALGLSKSNFYLYGHSWGGILAIEYALQYQQHLKGLIISNMMASAPRYNQYVDNVLAKKMRPEVVAEIRQIENEQQFDNPRYIELLLEHYYSKHFLRIPFEKWPDPVSRSFSRMNQEVYVLMQGPSEFGLSKSALLADWDRTEELSQIRVPTLVIGAEHDTMDPKHMAWMAKELRRGRYLYCPDGSHMAMYDDQRRYFDGLIKFIREVDSGALQ